MCVCVWLLAAAFQATEIRPTLQATTTTKSKRSREGGREGGRRGEGREAEKKEQLQPPSSHPLMSGEEVEREGRKKGEQRTQRFA